MATQLNKSRMRNSKFFILLAIFIVLFTKTLIPYETVAHEAMEFVGYFLVSFCALGRLYSTAFLGGFKNQRLITSGAFSVVRNPLYFFSLIGIVGISLISGHIVVIIGLPLAFIVIYHQLIKREELFLENTFNQEYREYSTLTPRLIPNLKLYQAPQSVEVVPKYLNKAFKDAIWWFAPFPVFELAEFLQESGRLITIFTMP